MCDTDITTCFCPKKGWVDFCVIPLGFNGFYANKSINCNPYLKELFTGVSQGSHETTSINKGVEKYGHTLFYIVFISE